MLGCTESEEQYFKFVIRYFNIFWYLTGYSLTAYLLLSRRKCASRIYSKVVNESILDTLIYNLNIPLPSHIDLARIL